jgi:fatty acid cis/trans isomerase CTI
VMNFIKGPVCRGSMALDVIRDRFWVFFTPPKSAVPKQLSAFLSAQDDHLRLPAESGSRLLSLATWNGYARAQNNYLKAKGDFLRSNISVFEQVGLGSFWDGGPGRNPNAALTVFRHHDSATVVQGLVGEPPQTAWLIDYPILERIHYLLVAGFDIYGTASHQVMTRLYMDFLRMESEMNFVAFLPPTQRRAEIADWYRGAADSVRDYVGNYFDHEVLPAPYVYKTTEYKRELFETLQARLAPALNRRHELASAQLSANELAAMRRIEQIRGAPAARVPQSVVVELQGRGLYTLTSDSALTNLSSIFGEEERRVVAEDRLTIAPGVLTAYPDALWSLRPADLPELADRLAGLRSEADFEALLDRFGVRRTDPAFWAVSDRVLADYRRSDPIAAGVLDYNRYDNR